MASRITPADLTEGAELFFPHGKERILIGAYRPKGTHGSGPTYNEWRILRPDAPKGHPKSLWLTLNAIRRYYTKPAA